jgi:glutamyl-Q tRNA(Asp) synthetase
MTGAVFRFAPSPNGKLHLGHAYSALLNEQMAKAAGGRLLLRIEDIDQIRCSPSNIATAIADLTWLGLHFESPVLHQSQRMSAYRDAIARLMELELLYVCTCTRRQLSHRHGEGNDPDGQPLYPRTCRRIARIYEEDSALRLQMDEAVAMARRKTGNLSWLEKGVKMPADPMLWGDVIIARKAIGTSYHLSVVVDDAFQNVTDVVRGEDLYHATAIHRVLQVLLDLPEPRYHHHGLVRHDSGRKLAKSKGDRSLADLRADGATSADIRHLLGFKNPR